MKFINGHISGFLGVMKAASVALVCVFVTTTAASAAEGGRDGFWYSKKYMTSPEVSQSVMDRHQIRLEFGSSVKAEKKNKGLNLLSGSLRERPKRVSYRVLGSGSYICSPAGFGRRSTCRRN
ncbi:hypothetical protein [Aestuariivita boseongensis]|uniref:hypothetical protein n=1 Tax=Aestuariivita boseongensis TaxID=1470562 RepID=UPI0012FA6251|nr:hypothetical protein [Aestuariivita boseongensis]